MNLFSHRMGLKPIKNIIQADSMDSDLRNTLWNVLEVHYWRPVGVARSRELLADEIWMHYFKKPVDTLPDSWTLIIDSIRDHFFDCKWNEVYDFLEFIVKTDWNPSRKKDFISDCNVVLKRELSGYRFIDDKLARISSEEEIAAIEEALKSTDRLKPVRQHLKRAIELFSDRKSPDYRNSIKESISAVESLCKKITQDDNATLGKALKRLEDKIEIHTALKESFDHLYGYTSDADGIRHALLKEPSLDFEDAKFMLVSCSGFTNYLIVKSAKAGIKL